MIDCFPLFGTFPDVILTTRPPDSIAQSDLHNLLHNHVAVLFRAEGGTEIEAFKTFVHNVSSPLDYTYRSSPRTRVSSKLYTATEYPREFTIAPHCENAYQSSWPMQLFFYCAAPAESGGNTPLTDMRSVTSQLDPDAISKFERLGVKYVRNYGTGFDFSWEEAFQTNSRYDVEAFCGSNGLKLTWREDNMLRTEQTLPAFAKHPRNNANLWFNQAHMFHVSSLDCETRDALLSIFEPNDLPRNAYYGDGSIIEDDVLEYIRELHERNTHSFAWHAGDILVIDNMYVAHGRQPYTGERRVLVMMGNAHRSA